jgi:hypothetical protein
MIFSPNHIFVPVAYLAIVGSGRCFSAGNPVYTVAGRYFGRFLSWEGQERGRADFI